MVYPPGGAVSGGSGVSQTRPGFLGYYAEPTDLPSTYASIPVMAGDYAVVGFTDTIWVYDGDSTSWQNTEQQIDLSNSLFRDGTNSPTANVSWAGYKLTNVGSPTSGGDATNKTYVDNTLATISWREPVLDIVETLPETGTEGDRIALTTGSIHKYVGGSWIVSALPTIGAACYSIAGTNPYFWDGTVWKKISSSLDTSGVLLSDGTVFLVNDWIANDTGYNYQIKSLGDGDDLRDAATLHNVHKVRVSMVAEPVDIIEDVLTPVGDLESKSVGYRYIRVSDLKICEKISSTEWIYADSKEGALVFDKTNDRFYYFDGTGWRKLENNIDPSEFDLTSLTLPHSQITNSNVDNYHPMYLKVDGKISMVTNGLNMSASGTPYRITNLRDGFNPNDAVNMRQLGSVASGVTWIDPCVGIYNTPPDGSAVPRLIVGEEPNGDFASHAQDIAYWPLPDGPWQFIDPVKGQACLLTDDGELWEGNLLNNAKEQWIFNGETWVVFYGAMLHDNLADAAMSTKHTRYLRNDFPGEANGYITFSPDGHSDPFAVDADHTSVVTNLNVDLVDGYHATTEDTAGTVAVRDVDKRLMSSFFEGNRLYVVDKFDPLSRDYTTIYSDKISVGENGELAYKTIMTVGFPRQNSEPTHIVQTLLEFNGYSSILKDGVRLISADDSKWLDYVTYADFPVDDSARQEGYGLFFNGTNWVAQNPNDVSGTPHSALTELNADDHTQYLTNGRHDLTTRHTLGSIVPHDNLDGLTDVEVSEPQNNQALLFDSGSNKWINSFVPAGSYYHDDFSGVGASTAHRAFSMLDGSRMYFGNLHIRDSLSYTDPITLQLITRLPENNLNCQISMGTYDGLIKFEDYDIRGAYNKFLGATHGIQIKHGGNVVKVGAVDNTANGHKFTVTTEQGRLLNIVHGDGTRGSSTVTADEWQVYHDGCARITGTEPIDHPEYGGAIPGLNANYLQGKTLEEISQGGSIDHGVLRNLYQLEGEPEGTYSDHHPQYFNSARHNTTGAHTLGSVVPHDSLNGLTDVTIGVLHDNDILKYESGQGWINSPISGSFVHDEVEGVSDATGHTKYIRNDIKQILVNGHLEFANDISVVKDSTTRIVPFTLNETVEWSGAVPLLNSDMVDGLHASDLIKVNQDNVITGNNTFQGVSDFQDPLKIPESHMLDWATDPEGAGLPSERELFIHNETGILMYRWDGNTYWLATKDGAIEGTSEACFRIDMKAVNGGIRVCNYNGTALRVSNQYGDIADVRLKDLYAGNNQVVTTNTGTGVSTLDNIKINCGEIL